MLLTAQSAGKGAFWQKGMDETMKKYLVLQDGRVFEGEAFGSLSESIGELVFTTGMCGYIETLTDPSYYGQIVMQTFPMIGNYGIIPSDFEGKCHVKGYVVREKCDVPSNFRSEYDLDRFLKENRIPGIYGVDTRELTRIIREYGVMNAILCNEYPENLSAVGAYAVTNAVNSVTSSEMRVFSPMGEKRYKVVLLDTGAKANIVRSLVKRGCEVLSVPANTTAEEMLSLAPDGVMLSNGPGDPTENVSLISEIGKLFGRVPIFGICLGHQLMALSQGAKTVKLKYGHRGANQPVKDVCGTRTFITSQNHGYAVVSDSLKNGVVRYINANDGTCEGIDYPEYRAFSVQFHPEACSGPKDTEFLFDRFCDMMAKGGVQDAD